jgi:ATP-dependent protease Clp ATPase subunit
VNLNCLDWLAAWRCWRGGDIVKAQRRKVFIDEIDKLKSIEGEQRGTAGERVQHALLKTKYGAASDQTVTDINIPDLSE